MHAMTIVPIKFMGSALQNFLRLRCCDPLADGGVHPCGAPKAPAIVSFDLVKILAVFHISPPSSSKGSPHPPGAVPIPWGLRRQLDPLA